MLIFALETHNFHVELTVSNIIMLRTRITLCLVLGMAISASAQQLAIDTMSFHPSTPEELVACGISPRVDEPTLDYDLMIRSYRGPSWAYANEGGTYTAVVYNNGKRRAMDYKIITVRNGHGEVTWDFPRVFEPGMALTFNCTIVYPYPQVGQTHTFQYRIDFIDDEDNSNNDSEVISTEVLFPRQSQVEKINGEVADGKVSLSWDYPTAYRVSDDMEGHTLYLTDYVEQYIFCDEDGGITRSPNDADIPNVGSPMAFMVLDPERYGLGAAHSGQQVLASFPVVNPDTGEAMAKDDWFLSPWLLPGHTFSCWIKSALEDCGNDMYELLYTNISSRPSDFTSLGEPKPAPKEWTKVEVKLPDYSGSDGFYVAVRATSTEGNVLLIDDVECLENLPPRQWVEGYKLYRDGVLLASLPYDGMEYIDEPEAEGEYSYTVTALYSVNGAMTESAPCEPYVASVKSQGIHDLIVEKDITVYGQDGALIIEGGQVCDAMVATVTGRVLLSGSLGASRVAYPLPGGIYIVKVDSKYYKLMLK